MACKLYNLLFYCILLLLLLQSLHSQEAASENENGNEQTHISEDNKMNIVDENLENAEIINDESNVEEEEGEEEEEEEVVDPNLEQLYTLLRRMYSSVTHGDSRYFNMIIKELKNDTLTEYLDDENIMEAIETNFVHILNTMHLVSEIAIKIHATPMQINNMNDGLFLCLKTMVKFLKKSRLNNFISDSTYSMDYNASFVNLLFCEGISLSLQFRLIKTLKYFLLPSVMNNTEQYYCFDTYHNIINQSLLHIATKSRASGFVRLFFHLPTSLPVMKNLHINNKGLIKIINKNNPIINQQMIKKRMSDIDVLIILKASFKLNLPNSWYLRKDINDKSAFDLWINRSPYYLRHVYYHSVISKLFSTHHKHIDIDNDTCIAMGYIEKYWPTIQWFPIPNDNNIDNVDIDTTNHNIAIYQGDKQGFDDFFVNKWNNQQPFIYRQSYIYDKWNLSQLTLDNLSVILKDEIFLTSNIPYQDLYDDTVMNEEQQRYDREERSVTFDEFRNEYLDNLQSGNIEIMCKELEEKKKLLKKARSRQKKKNLESELDISYIFDNNIYWTNEEFISRFNHSDLIPKYIYNLMKSMIDDYNIKFDAESNNKEEDRIKFDLNEVVSNTIMLKQVSIGGIFSGAQPHFHGPAFNVLLKGEKQWILFPPNKAFQMKQTAIEFFCYHETLSEEKRNNLTYYTFTQNVGDIVFIPHEWSHAVLNQQPSGEGLNG